MEGRNRIHVAILVHGTGATAGSSQGSRWWQDTGPLWSRLSLLDPSTVVPEAFIWSGQNDELERRSAGARLASRIAEAADSNQSVHLVGHSHGGSVIWHALASLASRGRNPTETVASVCTIGTPFLHWGVRSSRLLTMSLILLASLSFVLIAGFAVLRSSWQFAWRDATASVLGWSILTALGIAILLWSAVWLLRSRIRARAGLGDLEGSLARQFRDSYLCIWSRLDEPIIGLGASGSISLQLTQGGNLVTRATNQVASNALSRLLQGCNLAHVELRGAAPWPVNGLAHNALPAEIDDSLIALADENSAQLGRKVRSILASGGDPVSGFVNLQRSASEALTFKELVHTTYFDNAACIDLITSHIANRMMLSSKSTLTPSLALWYDSRYQTSPVPIGERLPSNAMGAAVGLASVAIIAIWALAASLQWKLAGDSFALTRGESWVPVLANSNRLANALVEVQGSTALVTSHQTDSMREAANLGVSLNLRSPRYLPLRNYLRGFSGIKGPETLGKVVAELPSPRLREIFSLIGIPIVAEEVAEADIDHLLKVESLLPGDTPISPFGGARVYLAPPSLERTSAILTRRGLMTVERYSRLSQHCKGDTLCINWLHVFQALAFAGNGQSVTASKLLPLPSYQVVVPESPSGPIPGTRINSVYHTRHFDLQALSDGADEAPVSRAIEWAVQVGEWDYAIALLAKSRRATLSWNRVHEKLENELRSVNSPTSKANQLLHLFLQARFTPSVPSDFAEQLQTIIPMQVDHAPAGRLSQDELRRLQKQLLHEHSCESGGPAARTATSCTKSVPLDNWHKSLRGARSLHGESGLLSLLVARPIDAPPATRYDAVAGNALLDLLVSGACDGQRLFETKEALSGFDEALLAIGPPTELPPQMQRIAAALEGQGELCSSERDRSSWSPSLIDVSLHLAAWLETRWTDVAAQLANTAAVRQAKASVAITDPQAIFSLGNYLLERWKPSFVLLVTQANQNGMAVLRRQAYLEVAICRHAANRPDAALVAERAFGIGMTQRALARGEELGHIAILEGIWHARQGDWRRAAHTCENCEIQSIAKVTRHVLPLLLRGIPMTESPADCQDALSVDVSPLLAGKEKTDE